jgi:beta-galactosidase beta subunit
VDIQHCIAGGEIIEWLPAGVLVPMETLSSNTEHWRDHGEPTTHIRMFPGAYAMFLPHELHRPKLTDGTNTHIKKLVIKIRRVLLLD